MTESKNVFKELTPEQEARLPYFRDKWLEIGMATGPGDRKVAEEGVTGAYKEAKLDLPQVFLWFRSPKEGCEAAAVLAKLPDDQDLSVLTEDFVRGLMSSVTDSERQQQASSAIFGQQDAGWLAFYDAFKEFGVDECKRLEPLNKVAENAGWWWAFAGAAILTERPTEIHLEDERLHNPNGPAIAYPDGFGVYAWRGTRVPQEWIMDKDNVDPNLALTWSNIEQRRCLAEIIGWDKILKLLDAKVVDENPDPEIGTLLQADIPDSPGQKFLQVRCGTGRHFVIPVDPEILTAADAQAWVWQDKEYAPEVRT